MPPTPSAKPFAQDDKTYTSDHRSALGSDVSIFSHRVNTAKDRGATELGVQLESKNGGNSGIKGNGDKSDG
jgi:hypothetical protein